MTDMHAHILPELDDGARDIKESVAMLAQAKAQGITTVISTSHYYGRLRSPEQFLEVRNAAFEKIRPSIPSGVEVRLGAEVHFTENNVVKGSRLCPLAIDGTKYILFELPFHRVWGEKLLQEISAFIDDTGYAPIIAHVERYPSVRKNPKIISQLIQIGCLIQVNAAAFYEKHAKSFAYALLKRGFIHCIGTDMHNVDDRAPDYDKMVQALEKDGLMTEYEKVQDCMRRILDNQPITTVSTPSIKRFFNSYR